MQVAIVFIAAEQMLQSLLLHNAEQYWHKCRGATTLLKLGVPSLLSPPLLLFHPLPEASSPPLPGAQP